MPQILITSMSPIGHIGPLLNLARGLVDRGDHVTVLTAAAHAAKVSAAGARHRALPPQTDLDEARLDEQFPGRSSTTGIHRVDFDITNIFVKPMPHQSAALADLFSHNRFDAVISDAMFFGILPFLLGDPAARPPILTYSTTPLFISSRDTGPTGLGLHPSSSPFGRLRNRALTALTQRVLLRGSHAAANHLLDRLNAPRLPVFVTDSGLLADRCIAPTVPEFDYPRSDLPSNVRYVGAVHPAPTIGFRPPSWWHVLDGDRPVVHVTQGTIDNADLTRLLAPTIEALADTEVTVVATTGGRPVSALGDRLPANAYVSEYLPHDVLLPKVDVMVTNGGYGAVQRALAAGVPMVVAGDTEDKPEVAARVAWSGAGVNLKTGTPSPHAVRAAVRTVLDRRSYRDNACRLQAALARRDGVAEIAALIDEVIAERGARVR
ncbi:glycosyl transferase [Mycobacterium sp. 852013-51886_SCH5428379]|uniref:nucleotide disphospho-sugar-binding domain-containing protein n=1 Tax=Mycobacterium sp. 852013-51886_SCH5428379 TaxID=1834111 RepID=UPI000801BB84|nr:glycosyltransferase [Mycobacterium sp. 852013-51886_SCH5428379]OBB56044.1 glycosyl transferase [Mycobacterium sp. 852013-51886_SCH5428379]